jgi:hypothetical protein
VFPVHATKTYRRSRGITPLMFNMGTRRRHFIVKIHIYLKIFVAEEQYRRLHTVPVPLITPDAIITFYFTCIPFPSLP